jgi:Methyltransferase domain
MSALRRVANRALRPCKLALHKLRADDPASHKDLPQRHFDNCRVFSKRSDLLCALPSGGIVAEIGVAYGDFSSEILRLNRPSELHLIDLWKGERYEPGFKNVTTQFHREIAGGGVVIHRGLSVEIMSSLPSGMFDWVYLDAGHGYAGTVQELALCRRILKKDGRIAGHDFCTGNPYSALPYGVIQAVYEFCLEHDWEMEYVTLDADGHFSFCVRPMASEGVKA